ncbi:protein far-red impaired response 1-like, partial [Trifolium pratense]
EDTTKGSALNKFFKVFRIEKVHNPDEVDDDNDDDADNDNDGPSNIDVLDEEIQENLFPSFEDHARLDERVVTVDIRSKSFSCTCRMFENKDFLGRRVFKILEFLGGSVQYHCLKTIPGQYVLKRWTRDVRLSVDKLKSTISVGTEDTTQAQRYQQICAVIVQLSTLVYADFSSWCS